MTRRVLHTRNAAREALASHLYEELRKLELHDLLARHAQVFGPTTWWQAPGRQALIAEIIDGEVSR